MLKLKIKELVYDILVNKQKSRDSNLGLPDSIAWMHIGCHLMKIQPPEGWESGPQEGLQ